MKAIKLLMYALAGLVASNSLTAMAIEFEAIRWIVLAGVAMWMWTLTNHGHEWGKKLLRLDDAEMGTLRFALLVIFVVGILIENSFGGMGNG